MLAIQDGSKFAQAKRDFTIHLSDFLIAKGFRLVRIKPLYGSNFWPSMLTVSSPQGDEIEFHSANLRKESASWPTAASTPRNIWLGTVCAVRSECKQLLAEFFGENPEHIPIYKAHKITDSYNCLACWCCTGGTRDSNIVVACPKCTFTICSIRFRETVRMWCGVDLPSDIRRLIVALLVHIAIDECDQAPDFEGAMYKWVCSTSRAKLAVRSTHKGPPKYYEKRLD